MKRTIDLVPDEYRLPGQIRAAVVRGGLFFVIGLGAMLVFTFPAYRNVLKLDNELAPLRAEIDSMNLQNAALPKVVDELTQAKELQERMGELLVLPAWNSIFPSIFEAVGDHIRLTSLRIIPLTHGAENETFPFEIVLRGVTRSGQEVAQFMQVLAENPWLSRPTLRDSQKEISRNGIEYVEFDVSVRLQ